MRDRNEYFDNPDLLFIDIADAIREKTGETGLIDAVDFPEKIKAVETTIDYVNEDIQHVSNYAYKGMDKLRSISLPNVIEIGEFAFAYCRNLVDVNIGDKVTSINSYIFGYSDKISTISIPDSVTSISTFAFDSSRGLRDINVSSGNNYYLSIEGTLFNKNKDGILRYAPGKLDTHFTIPEGVAKICNGAFRDCENLLNVDLPASLNIIESNSFIGCRKLDTISLPEGVTTIESCTFMGCDSLKSIVIPHSITSIDSYAFDGCNTLSDVFYYGTIEDWNNISVNEYGNEYLANTTIRYIDDPSKQVRTIKYDGNGSNISIDNAMYVDGDTITLVYTQPTQFLHRFLGWSTTPDATEAQYQPGDSYTVTEDVTLYAVWEQTAQVKTLTYQTPETVDSAIISVGGEHYYFKFTPTESGYYTFSSTIPDGEGDGYCYLYDAQGSQLASDDDGAGNLNFNLGYTMQAGTTYYYGVKYWDGNATGTIPVRLFMEVK